MPNRSYRLFSDRAKYGFYKGSHLDLNCKSTLNNNEYWSRKYDVGSEDNRCERAFNYLYPAERTIRALRTRPNYDVSP